MNVYINEGLNARLLIECLNARLSIECLNARLSNKCNDNDVIVIMSCHSAATLRDFWQAR